MLGRCLPVMQDEAYFMVLLEDILLHWQITRCENRHPGAWWVVPPGVV